jgi:MFS family permease
VPDPLGITLVAAVPAALSYSLVEGPARGWSDPTIVGGFVLAAALLPVFLWRTARAASPVIDLSLFRDRQFSLVNAATVLFAAAFYGMLLSNVVFLQTVWHYSVLRAALASTPGPALVALLARTTSKLAGRIGHRPVLVAGAVVWAAGAAGFALFTGTRPEWWAHWLVFNLLIGLGISMTLPVQSAAVVATLPPARYAVGSAVNASCRQLGAVLGVSLFVAVLGTPAPGRALGAFQHGWWLFAALTLASGSLQLLPRLKSRVTAVNGRN